jgi:tRNA A-37 threonylcarbamoyl transferase component Bud32
MRIGTFNKVIRIGKYIIKLSTDHTSIAKEMLKLDSKDIKKYERDISNVGIKTSKVFLSFYCEEKNFIIQEYIEGLTVQEYLDSPSISKSDKLKLYKKIVDLYKLSMDNPDLCLDWNLNNFIVQKGEPCYVDYVPALYKSKIKEVKSSRLEQYKESLVEPRIQLAGIITYAIVPFFQLEKKELLSVYNTMIKYTSGSLGIDVTPNGYEQHIYLQKLEILNEYLFSDMNYEEFLPRYQDLSMRKTGSKRKVKNESRHK